MIDLTKDGRAVPGGGWVGGDSPQPLWVAENEYAKVRANLLGL